MYLTREFQRAVIGLFLFALLLTGVYIILKVNNLYGLMISDPNTLGRLIVNQSLHILEIIALWWAIAYITKERIGAIVAAAMQLILISVNSYIFFSREVTEELFFAIQAPRILAQILPYILFGVIHFKKSSGLLMLLVPVILTGIGAAFKPSEYYGFINNLFRIIDWDDFMEFEVRNAAGSTIINVFEHIISNLYLPLQLIIFWFIYTKIKFSYSFNKTLNIVHVSAHISQTTFSVIYWVLRLTLFVIALGILDSVKYLKQSGFYFSIYVLFTFCLAVYAVGSMYRNFLVSYLISKGKYPSWLYLLLQIPVLHIFGWIVTFLFKPKPLPVTPGVEAESETPAISSSTAMARVAQARDDYEYSLENRGIKILLIVVLFILWVIPNELTGDISGTMRTIGIINFILSIWFIVDRRSLLPLYIIQSIAVIILYLSGNEEMMKPILTFSLVNMVVYFALFHFASFEFIEDNDELLSDSTGSLNNG